MSSLYPKARSEEGFHSTQPRRIGVNNHGNGYPSGHVASASPYNSATAVSPKSLDLRAQFLEQLSRVPIDNAAAFFERLIRNLDKVTPGVGPMDAKDRWLAYLGLRAMYTEAKLSRFDRDIRMLQATWAMLEPLLRENGLLLEYTLDIELQEMIERFLTNQPPALQSRAQRLAFERKRRTSARKRNRLRLPAIAQADATFHVVERHVPRAEADPVDPAQQRMVFEDGSAPF